MHHADRPLLVVPAVETALAGPVVVGYDGSPGARAGVEFAAAHLSARKLIVTNVWRSPVRHSVRGYALTHSGVAVFEDYATGIDSVFRGVADELADEGAQLAGRLGAHALGRSFESGGGDWQGLVGCARMLGASAVVVGTYGGGALTTTVLGSVASGLVHAAELPVLIVP